MTAPRRRFAEGTEVPVERTRAELEKLLAKHGAQQIVVYRDINPPLRGRVIFRIQDRMVRLDVVPKISPGRSKHGLPQAEREAWRRLLLVVKAKLEIIADEGSTLEREFLADILMPDSRTVHESLRDQIHEAYLHGNVPALFLPSGD